VKRHSGLNKSLRHGGMSRLHR